MVTTAKPTGRALSVPAGLAIGTVVSLLVTILSAFVMAKLLQTEMIQWKDTGHGIMLLLLISSFLGAKVSAEKIKRQQLLICGLSGFIYFGMLLSITALFFGGQYEAVGVTGAMVLAGSGTAALLTGQEKRGGKRRKYGSRGVKMNKKRV